MSLSEAQIRQFSQQLSSEQKITLIAHRLANHVDHGQRLQTVKMAFLLDVLPEILTESGEVSWI